MVSVDRSKSPGEENIEPLTKVGSPRAVTILHEPETITPSQTPNIQPISGSSPHIHRASINGKRLSGRPSITQPSRPLASFTSQISNFRLDSSSVDDDGGETDGSAKEKSGNRHTHASVNSLLSQVTQWLQEEKSKRTRKKVRKQESAPRADEKDDAVSPLEISKNAPMSRKRSGSDASEGALALEKLEQIINQFVGSGKEGSSHLVQSHKSSVSSRKSSLFKKFRKESLLGGSSDTDYVDGDVLVPSADVWLDNTKTMAYTGGGAESESELKEVRRKDKEHWVTFKKEIVRLTHTLRLKGWRRVPIERGEEIGVERLSGALTNAVYVVVPPKNLPEPAGSQDGELRPRPRRQPQKLLLRVYGAQVDHLIDREAELQILRRLARKKIGPRLLGTFNNGRFEQFFNARTLTATDIRVPDTSKQIAKRMRELHEGIELLESERAGGPFVWCNWDKWVDRAQAVTTWLDQQILSLTKDDTIKPIDSWKQRGFVCGVEWAAFKSTVEKFRIWLDASCGGKDALKKQLVFAHNDAQYGNLLRLEPSGESPLLHPANQHKQLVVIDFEYANANTVGFELANHFTEWCYNYHLPTAPWACNTKMYPTPEEQTRFVRSYLNHRPEFAGSASSTPSLRPQSSPSIDPSQSPTISARSPKPSPSIAARSPRPLQQIHADSLSSSRVPTLKDLSLGAPAVSSPPPGSLEAFHLGARAPPSFQSFSSVSGTKPFSLTNTANYDEEERLREEQLNRDVQHLLQQVRLWRVACSAQWAVWGIVQAKVPGMDEALEARSQTKFQRESESQATANQTPDTGVTTPIVPLPTSSPPKSLDPKSEPIGASSNNNLPPPPAPANDADADADASTDNDSAHHDHDHPHSQPHLQSDPLDPDAVLMAQDAINKRPESRVWDEEDMDDESEEFDYLAYAQSRAMFFWGDVLQLGLVKEDELPEVVRRGARRLDY